VVEPDEIATTDIVLTISRDIEELKQARQEQKKLIAEKERLERNISELNQKIANLSYLDRFIGHQTI
jgi:cell division protein FtsB